MLKKLAVLCLALQALLPAILFSQGKSTFSGDPAKFREELTAFMGPNLNDEQKGNLGTFLASWDSAAFSKDNMAGIIDLASQFSGKGMRPVPHFNDLLITLNTIINKKSGDKFLAGWLSGLSELAFNPRYPMENIDRYIRNTKIMIRDNVLSESSAIRWKVKNSQLQFLHDTVFLVKIKDATLTCY